MVAVYLLQTRSAAQQEPATLVEVTQGDEAMMKVLEATHPPREEKKTRKWFYHSIAKLGGFMGRKGDGDPRWLTLWRGWQTLVVLARGYKLATMAPRDVGKD